MGNQNKIMNSLVSMSSLARKGEKIDFLLHLLDLKIITKQDIKKIVGWQPRKKKKKNA